MPNVLIVDDHVAVRAGLRSVLRLAPEIDVVGAVADGDEAAGAVADEAVDVALVDYHLRDADGLALCRALKRMRPALATVLYTAYDLRGFGVVAALAGVDAVLGKGEPADDVIATIAAVARGESRRPEVPPDAVRDSGRRIDSQDLPLLGLRVAGTSESDIADALQLSGDEVARRLDALVDRLRPRLERGVPRAAYGFAESEDGGFSPSSAPQSTGTIGPCN